MSTNGAQPIRTLTISIEPDPGKMREASRKRVLKALETGEYQGSFFTFSTPQQLFAVFSPKRWELMEKLQAVGPSSLRGLARTLGRDVKRVHQDVTALIAEGVIERNESNKLVVPFERIHVSFDLVNKAA
jgi:predicted transcriptional regulator